MKVRVQPADHFATGHYRAIWPAEVLAAQGHDVEIQWSFDAHWQDDYGLGVTRLVGVEPIEADVVVIQRPLRREMAQIIPHIQAQGIKVIVEIDDDFEHIPVNNTSYKTLHPKYNAGRNWQILRQACRDADFVTVSTPALAKVYGTPGRVAVLPNFVPDWYLSINRKTQHDIGWTGSVDTHPGDLEVTHGALAQVSERVRIIGTGKGVKSRLGLNYEPIASGWLELLNGEYQSLISTLKVGIVPLCNSAFNQAKSALKGLEYSALGVPFVASPTDEYKRLVAKGVGALAADRSREWIRELNRLSSNDAYWQEQRAAGIEVAKTMTYERNAWRWWETWEHVANRLKATA